MGGPPPTRFVPVLPASRGGSSAHSKKSQLSGCPHRRKRRPLFADSFFTVNSTDGLPQRQLGAEGFGSKAGADRGGGGGGAAREVDVDVDVGGGREGGGGRGGGGAGADVRSTVSAPQSAVCWEEWQVSERA